MKEMMEDKDFKEKMKDLMSRVRDLELGGDLEGIIEEGTEEITKCLYKQCLQLREEVIRLKQANFSPSGMSEVPRGDESGKAEKTAGANPSRDGSV